MKLSWWEFCSTCWSIHLQWGSIEDVFQCWGEVVISRENRPFEWEIGVGVKLSFPGKIGHLSGKLMWEVNSDKGICVSLTTFHLRLCLQVPHKLFVIQSEVLCYVIAN
jgi:hypothetical protein